MKWPLELGTIVKINPAGHEKYGSDLNNPPQTRGTVVAYPHGHRWTRVQWENGTTNAYERGTLDIVQTVQLEND